MSFEYFCDHPLPLIYDMETGEENYSMGQVYICKQCDRAWMVVPSPEPGINMWQQPHFVNIRASIERNK